jgi:hypothetical protein
MGGGASQQVNQGQPAQNSQASQFGQESRYDPRGVTDRYPFNGKSTLNANSNADRRSLRESSSQVSFDVNNSNALSEQGVNRSRSSVVRDTSENGTKSGKVSVALAMQSEALRQQSSGNDSVTKGREFIREAEEANRRVGPVHPADARKRMRGQQYQQRSMNSENVYMASQQRYQSQTSNFTSNQRRATPAEVRQVMRGNRGFEEMNYSTFGRMNASERDFSFVSEQPTRSKNYQSRFDMNKNEKKLNPAQVREVMRRNQNVGFADKPEPFFDESEFRYLDDQQRIRHERQFRSKVDQVRPSDVRARMRGNFNTFEYPQNVAFANEQEVYELQDARLKRDALELELALVELQKRSKSEAVRKLADQLAAFKADVDKNN